tara:strand:- start:6 stop:482 length:477 start_codon:yes stop_codon:yes gene_type:complete
MPKNTGFRIEYKRLTKYNNAMAAGPLRINQATMGLLFEDTKKARNFARNLAPRKTGNLRNAIKYRRKGEKYFTLYIDDIKAPYGPVQELGSKSYYITPKRAKVLRWYVNGKPVFAKKVKHPGIKAKRFMRKALNKAFRGFDKRLKRKHIEVFKRMGFT